MPKRHILKLLTTLRQSAVFGDAYQMLPLALRERLARWKARTEAAQFKFPRTRQWRTNNVSVSEVHPAALADTPARDADGVNIFAFARGQFGLAEGARLYARALHNEGCPVAIRNIDVSIAHAMRDVSVDTLVRDDAPYATNLFFINPDMLPAALAHVNPHELQGRRNIACWFWELEHFPRTWEHALDHVDSLLASSKFVFDVLKRATDKPVFHVPLPILDGEDAGLQRSDFGLPESAFVFLSSFDFNSSVARKNPEASIRAFREAFPGDEADVLLLVKTSNGERYPDQLRALQETASGDPRVLVRDDIIDRSQMRSLQRCADAYVSLHRAEGFGLGMAECMRLGKPVIATAWSGNMDFMTPETGCLVDFELIPVGEGEYPHHTGQRWADPDILQASRFMKYLASHPDRARELGRRASAHIRSNFSAPVVARELVRILADSGIRSSPDGKSGQEHREHD